MQIPQANYKTRLQSPGSQKHPADSDRCLATNFNVFAYWSLFATTMRWLKNAHLSNGRPLGARRARDFSFIWYNSIWQKPKPKPKLKTKTKTDYSCSPDEDKAHDVDDCRLRIAQDNGPTTRANQFRMPGSEKPRGDHRRNECIERHNKVTSQTNV